LPLFAEILKRLEVGYVDAFSHAGRKLGISIFCWVSHGKSTGETSSIHERETELVSSRFITINDHITSDVAFRYEMHLISWTSIQMENRKDTISK